MQSGECVPKPLSFRADFIGEESASGGKKNRFPRAKMLRFGMTVFGFPVFNISSL
jgi:hypothetical protein